MGVYFIFKKRGLLKVVIGLGLGFRLFFLF